MSTPQDFFAPGLRYAIVGASANHSKYGYKVFHDLQSAGLTAIPVNPKLTELDGASAVAAIENIQPLPDVAVMIIPAEIGLAVMERAAAAGQKKFWFQPGAESQAIRDRADELQLEVMADGSCIMVDRLR
jgi:predicted CoA-binding protein